MQERGKGRRVRFMGSWRCKRICHDAGSARLHPPTCPRQFAYLDSPRTPIQVSATPTPANWHAGSMLRACMHLRVQPLRIHASMQACICLYALANCKRASASKCVHDSLGQLLLLLLLLYRRGGSPVGLLLGGGSYEAINGLYSSEITSSRKGKHAPPCMIGHREIETKAEHEETL